MPSVAVDCYVDSEFCSRLLAISCREHSSRDLDCKPSDQRFPEPGGKSLNIFATPLSRFFSFFSALLDNMSSALPRQINCLVLVSNKSTTRVPSL
jgi:hypothetical protein